MILLYIYSMDDDIKCYIRNECFYGVYILLFNINSNEYGDGDGDYILVFIELNGFILLEINVFIMDFDEFIIILLNKTGRGANKTGVQLSWPLIMVQAWKLENIIIFMGFNGMGLYIYEYLMECDYIILLFMIFNWMELNVFIIIYGFLWNYY